MFDNLIKILVRKREIRRISSVVINMSANMPYNCEIINKNGEITKYCDIPDIAKYFIYKANFFDSEVRYDTENDKPYDELFEEAVDEAFIEELVEQGVYC